MMMMVKKKKKKKQCALYSEEQKCRQMKGKGARWKMQTVWMSVCAVFRLCVCVWLVRHSLCGTLAMVLYFRFCFPSIRHAIYCALSSPVRTQTNTRRHTHATLALVWVPSWIAPASRECKWWLSRSVVYDRTIMCIFFLSSGYYYYVCFVCMCCFAHTHTQRLADSSIEDTARFYVMAILSAPLYGTHKHQI